LVTRRAPLKGFKVASYISSPFPKLSWRKDIHLFRSFGSEKMNVPFPGFQNRHKPEAQAKERLPSLALLACEGEASQRFVRQL